MGREGSVCFPKLLNPRFELMIILKGKCGKKGTEILKLLPCHLFPGNSSQTDDNQEECSGGLVPGDMFVSPDLLTFPYI